MLVSLATLPPFALLVVMVMLQYLEAGVPSMLPFGKVNKDS